MDRHFEKNVFNKKSTCTICFLIILYFKGWNQVSGNNHLKLIVKISSKVSGILVRFSIC